MGKYIKQFETHSAYNTYITGQDKVLPNVSYCEDNNEVHYNIWYDPEKFVAKFNVTDTTTATSLFNNPTLLKKLEIDGVVQPNVVTSYTFSTTGIHTVKYTLNDNVTSIDGASFNGKSNMISITIPNTITIIGDSAFAGCTSLTSVSIPNGITSIGNGAFSGCRSLKTITIPNSVTSIGAAAFGGCRSLKTITIPSSVTTINGSLGDFDFEDVIFESINPNATFVRDATNKVLTNIAGDTLICGFDNTNTIAPNTITSIGGAAFNGCTSLTSVSIPNGITSIGNGAFAGCTSLTSITIPNSVTTIGYNAFSTCTSLTSVTIGNSVTSIANVAFGFCSALTSVTVQATTPPALSSSSSAFVNTNNCPIYVPSTSVETYKAASGWSDYASRIQAIPSV